MLMSKRVAISANPTPNRRGERRLSIGRAIPPLRKAFASAVGDRVYSPCANGSDIPPEASSGAGRARASLPA